MRASLLALALLVPLVPALPFSGLPCEGYRLVDGQGPSCPVDGGWEVLLPDGTRVATHGPDRAHGNPLGLVNPPPPAAPHCVAGEWEHSLRVVYARPPDVPNDYAAKAPILREMVAQANGLLRAEAAAHGEVADLRVMCTGGVVDVISVVTRKPSSEANFGNIIQDLRVMGLNGATTKKWVFFDYPVDCACAGQATIFQDDRLVFENLNNAPIGWTSHTSYAITYTLDPAVWLHEALHTLGAAQRTAPHGTAANHCTDGLDVMCYDDGGGLYDGGVCADRTHVDCNGDDYFRPLAPRGSYLAGHWNVASHLSRFLQFGTEMDPPTVTFVAPAPGVLHGGCAGPLGPWRPDRGAFLGEGCVRLSVSDATGVGRVEVYVDGAFRGKDASGGSEVTVTFPIPHVRTGSILRIDAYDVWGNFGRTEVLMDLLREV